MTTITTNPPLLPMAETDEHEKHHGPPAVTADEGDWLQRQLDFPDVGVSFFSLFRYASASDVAVLVVSTVCALVAGALVPLSPIVFGRIARVFAQVSSDAEAGEAAGDAQARINEYTLYFVYIAVVALAAWFVSTAGFVHAGARMVRRLKLDYLAAVLRQNMALLDALGGGQVVAQLGADANAVQEGLSHKLALTVSAVGTLLATLAAIFALDWTLAFILLWSFVLGLLLLFCGKLVIARFGGRSLEAAAAGAAVVEDALASIRSVTVLGCQGEVRRGYEAHLAVAEKAGFVLKSFMEVLVALAVFTGFANVSLALWKGAQFQASGRTSFADLVALLVIVKGAAFCVLGISQNAEAFVSATAAASRMLRMVRRESPIDPSRGGIVAASSEGGSGEIELQSVRHVYPSRPGVVVLDELTLRFAPGETTAIVGPSGSGKSSIAHLLLRFYDPVGGRILLDGVDLRDADPRWLRQRIRIVGQEPFLFGTSIYENIEHGLVGTRFEHAPPEERRARVMGAARAACAHDFIARLRLGYETTVGERGSQLSGGQRQRIAIARALAADSAVLIFDEATSALDTETEARVLAAVWAARGPARTDVVIAHRLSTVRAADRIVVLEHGRVAEQGRHAELIDADGVYARLVGAQNRDGTDDASAPALEELGGEVLEGEQKGSVLRDSGSTSTVSANPEAALSLPGAVWFILKLNAPEWRPLLLGFICAVVAGFEEPASAILFAKATVALASASGSSTSDATFYSWMFFVLALGLLAVFGIEGSLFAYCSERLVHRARSMALAKILTQDMAFFDQPDHTSGALASFVSTQTADLAGVAGGTLGIILICLSTIVSALAIALAFGWKLGLVCASLMPILLCSGFLGVGFSSEFERQTERFAQRGVAYASEAVAGIQTVLSLTREQHVLASFRASLDAVAAPALRANAKASFLFALAQSCYYACMALGLWYGGTLIVRHEYSLFQFVVVYMAITLSAYSAGIVFSFTPNIGRAHKAAAALKRLLDTPSAIDPTSPAGQDPRRLAARLEFRGVSFAYPARPDRWALRDVSFAAPPGARVALVGATGSGKSSVAALLARFYDPQAGEILLDATPVAALNVAKHRRAIAMVNQEPSLHTGTIRANLLAGLDGDGDEEATPLPDDAALERACRQADIWAFVASLPEGLDTPVGGRGGRLSGGQKQRVALARALLRRPKILILDEATSALDSVSEALVQAALEAIEPRPTTVAIAHRLSTVRGADLILVMDGGRIVERGGHEELMRRRGKYYQLYMARTETADA